MESKMLLPRGAEFIIDRLNKQGYRADIVGGAVRDLYLGRIAPDYDITTNARPDIIKDIFSDVRTIDTGIKHGTVTVHVDGENYEVTTYRKDGEYKDARHPETVEFTDELAMDLSRRDFTMNAMCYNHQDGILDLFGGMRDIDCKVIRTVGDAALRFSEDALRILRALRFASVLDFEIEDTTRSAVLDKAHLLAYVSSERIYTEWKKLISGRGAYRIILEYRCIFEKILKINLVKLPKAELFSQGQWLARMLALFALCSDNPEESFNSAMLALHTDNRTRLLGEMALSALGKYSLNSVTDALFALSQFGEEEIQLSLDTGIITGKYTETERDILATALKSGIPYKLQDLAIGGRELIALGISGEAIGRELNSLLCAVIEGRCKNTRDALLEQVAKTQI